MIRTRYKFKNSETLDSGNDKIPSEKSIDNNQDIQQNYWKLTLMSGFARL